MQLLRFVFFSFLLQLSFASGQQLPELNISFVLAKLISKYDEITFNFGEPFSILGYQKRAGYERRIVFLEDNNNQKFILKCYGQEEKEEALCEYVGSFIGNSVGVPINKVKIISDSSFMVQIDNGTPIATLHTFVPGKELCKWYETPAHNIILKGGLISERHLNCLMLSDDLCDILALDIFLNNKDRHHENCFFDELTQRYFGIDMGDIFLSVRNFANVECELSDDIYEVISRIVSEEKIIALDTYQFLNTLREQDLSKNQKKSLKRVLTTLENLMFLYPIEIIFNIWISIWQKIGYDYTECKKIYLKLLLHRNMSWVDKVIEKIKILI